MFAVALLVFREVLEAALIISIACAATREVPRRTRYVLGGIGLGVLGAAAVAVGADFLSDLAGGAGQDLFNAVVLLSAVGMIGWHVGWMSSHSHDMATEIRGLGGAVKSGARPLAALLAVVALAVLREGSEIVLFLYGMAVGGTGAAALVCGIALGICGGGALGGVLYFGLLRVPLRQFFRVTNAMLILLAAGLASAAAGFLVQSDLVPTLGSRLWDTSDVVSDDSLIGRSLGVLVGYKAAPAGIQVCFYLGTVALLYAGLRRRRSRNAQ